MERDNRPDIKDIKPTFPRREGIELPDTQLSESPLYDPKLTVHKNGRSVTIPPEQVEDDEESAWIIATRRPTGKNLGS